jgi:aspartyl-tRNA(Asn)/glutamyl-tRNA(Gln) amidotransferase subunit C
MIEKKHIEILLELSRLRVEEEEKEKLVKDLDSIIEYVGHVNDVEIEGTDAEKMPVHNVLREDQEPHAEGMFTEDLLREVPEGEDGFIKVQKIL